MDLVNRGVSILLIAEYFRMGGTRTYFKQLLALYHKLGFGVTVVRSFSEQDIEIDTLLDKYGYDCIEIHDLYHKLKGTRFPLGILLERSVFKNIVNTVKPDIIVVSAGTPGLFSGVLGLTERSIYILHTYPILAHAVPRWKLKLKALMYRSIFRSTQLLTVSYYSKNAILRVWGLRNKDAIHVIHSTVGDILNKPKSGLNVSKTILTVGHVIGYKNPAAWLNVAKEVITRAPELQVRFVWVGEGELLDEYRKIVMELGLEQKINFVGMKSDVDLYYSECDIYFQPSNVESLGLSVLDALRHGIPCIVSSKGGLPEVVGNGECGWVIDVGNTEEIVARIIELLNNRSLYKQMSLAASERYMLHFSPALWERKMVSVHSDIIANSFL